MASATMTDGYAATRVHAMRTKLIGPGEYERLLKMSEKEVIAYLQGTEYREDVDALAVRDLDDPETIDRILARNDERVLEKLMEMSSERFRRVLQGTLLRNDLWNITVVAEAITGGASTRESIELYGRRGTIDMEPLLDAKSIEELAQQAARLVPGIDAGAKTFEEFVDMLSARRAKAFSEQLAHLTTDSYLIDEQNLLALVRLKRESVPAERIEAALVPGGTIAPETLGKAARAHGLRAALEALRGTQYREAVQGAIDSLAQHSLVRFENEVHRAVVARIRKATRRKPLGAELLIHFLTEREIERMNLRLLIKGKRLGLDEQFLRRHMVI